MKLHIVGGFLGSGKTTAIITATRYLISQGKKIGVVTNDMGSNLVDTAFFQNKNIHTVEIARGCFRCSFGELAQKLSQLQDTEKPDIVFAESVGSCGDLVATVIKPLFNLKWSKTPPTSFTVFSDSQLLLYYLRGVELPFSEPIVYLFEKQIEEAGLLILNKVDLLNPEQKTELKDRVNKAYPEKVIHFQTSTRIEDVVGWLDILEKSPDRLPSKSIQIDYEQYGQGEMRLAWMNQELSIVSPVIPIGSLLIKFIGTLLQKLREQNSAICHLKFMVATPENTVKISLSTIEQAGWQEELRGLRGSAARLLINARIEIKAEDLEAIVNDILRDLSKEPGIVIEEIDEDSFQPNFPRIVHRIDD